MSRVEEVTNTHTVDGALRDALVLLRGAPDSENVRNLIAEAERYLEAMAEWTTSPPGPRDRYEQISGAMQLITIAAAVAEGASEVVEELALPIARVVARVPLARRSRAPRGALPIPRPVSEGGPPSSPPISPRARQRSTAARPLALVRAHLEEWRDWPQSGNVRIKQISDRPTSLIIIRMGHNTTVEPALESAALEQWFVLEGVLTVGGDDCSSGDCVTIDPARQAVTSPGDATALVVGSTRFSLAAS